MKARIELDSMFIDDKIRLDLVPRHEPIPSNSVCIASDWKDTVDGGVDLVQAYFKVHERDAAGDWRELQDDDFTYPLQRKLQPALEEALKANDGAEVCEYTRTFRYAHIPLHQPRKISR